MDKYPVDKTESGENAFAHSWTLQADASALGFDWPDITGVLDKVEEELHEIRHALAQESLEDARNELGDLLFSSVNLARFLGIRPENAIQRTNRRFIQRFEKLRQLLAEEGKNIQSCALSELDALWDHVKVCERQQLEKGS